MRSFLVNPFVIQISVMLCTLGVTAAVMIIRTDDALRAQEREFNIRFAALEQKVNEDRTTRKEINDLVIQLMLALERHDIETNPRAKAQRRYQP